jgi:hypothetical protein
MTTTPDPMVDVVANACFVSRETAAWMLDCLEQKGFQLTKIPVEDKYELVHVNLPMACACDYQSSQELSDLIDEYLKCCGEWVDKYYVPELLTDYVIGEFAIRGDVEIYGDQWFGVTVTIFQYSEMKKYRYSIECDYPLHGLLHVWKDAKEKGLAN